MYLLPENNNDPSPLTRWILRVLFFGIVLTLVFFFIINIISGTGDVQKRGLEQALSDLTGAKVEIGTLQQFNLFPQFIISLEGISGAPGEKHPGFVADRLSFGKSFWDWLLNRASRVQEIEIKGLKTKPGAVGPDSLEIDSLSISKAEAGTPPKLELDGRYGTESFSATLDLGIADSGYIPTYVFGRGESLVARIGDFHLTGRFFIENGGILIDKFSLQTQGRDTLGGSLKFFPEEGKMKLEADFTSLDGDGSLVWDSKTRRQLWHFSKLRLDSVLADDAVWYRLYGAWKKIFPPRSEKGSGMQPLPLALKIDRIDGAVSAERIEANFIVGTDRIVGMWDGVSGGDSVECGVVNAAPSANKTLEGQAATDLGGKVVYLGLVVDPMSGRVSYHKIDGAGSISLSADERRVLDEKKRRQCEKVLGP